jgi:hypothetical protein
LKGSLFFVHPKTHLSFKNHSRHSDEKMFIFFSENLYISFVPFCIVEMLDELKNGVVCHEHTDRSRLTEKLWGS